MKLPYWLLMLLCAILFIGCTSDRFHVEREIPETKQKVTIDINIDYLFQKKGFKSLSYNTETGVVTVENFSTETSEVLGQFIEFISKMK